MHWYIRRFCSGLLVRRNEPLNISRIEGGLHVLLVEYDKHLSLNWIVPGHAPLALGAAATFTDFRKILGELFIGFVFVC